MNVINIENMIYLGKTVPKDWNWIKIDKKRIKKEAKGFKNLGIFVISKTIDKTINILII